MSYSACDFADDVTATAILRGFISEPKQEEIEGEDTPELAAVAVMGVLNTAARLRRELRRAYRELRNQGIDWRHPEMARIRRVLKEARP
jgi:hypothetical protein